MNILKKAQKLNDFWKKMLVFGILFVVAVPILIFIGMNFQKRMNKTSQGAFVEALNFSEIGEQMGESLDEFQALKQSMSEQFASSTMATSTVTSTDHYNGQETEETTE